MAPHFKPSTNSKPIPPENLRQLQWRLVVLLGVILPVITIVSIGGLLYAFLPAWSAIWPVLGVIFLWGAILVVFRDISQRKQTESEVAQRNHELTILQSAGVAITSRLDLRYVLDTVVHEMAKLLDVEYCTISEWNEVDNTVTEIAQYGPQGWGDATSKAVSFDLSAFPVTRLVLEEQIPAQMTISQPNLDPAEYKYMQEDEIKTQLLLPMVFQRRVLGLVELQDSRVERTFSHHEISLVKLLANQAASAIENARLYDDLRQHVAELTILNEISQAMISTLDLQKMLSIATDHILQLLEAAMTSVAFYYDEGDKHLWFVSASGKGTDIRGKRIPLAQGFMSWVIEYGKIALIHDLSKDPQFSNDLLLDEVTGLKTRSVLCVPLQTKYRTIGIIVAINKAHGYFDEGDVRLITLIAAPAAAAIENAQLFEQAQREIAERQRAEAALEEERALLALRVRERTAELSKANAELARASRLKDEFLAGMSHELRTPLNTILGSSEILQAGVFGELNEKQQRYAHNVEESGRHLLSLINDILDLSKVEAGKLELEIGPVSIQSVCEASLRLVKQLAYKKQLKVSTAYNNRITVLQADERRLKQILVNLLSNAIKFTPEEGEIGLEVSENPENQIVHFTVWDTGVGISQEDMPHLFQPFVQLDSSLARQQTGTGLGLSLVSRLTELHGGGVSLESEVGQGSRFTISLPYAGPTTIINRIEIEFEDEATYALNSVRKRRAGEQPLILLADDNEDNINMILEFLQAQGYQVTVARNGNEAIERAQEEKPDVILMDIQMPGIDGLAATRRLRADTNLANVPVIALTALAMPGDRERCLSAGANEYLSKPVSPTKLVNTIEYLLN
jgi:signal transduction histidine kinase/CheY-like chemotaxis protein